MSENHRDDFELATAAEQSSEEDEAQEGNSLAAAEESEESAEHEAIHIIDEDDSDLAGLLEALDAAMDPEADAIVDDALEIDSIDEADAAVAATEDEAELDAAEADPYDEFRTELNPEGVLYYKVWNGHAQDMPGFKSKLTKDDTWNLVEYLKVLRAPAK